MKSKLFVAFLAVCSLSYGCDLKRLDYEADTHSQKIISGIPSDEDRIKASLCFIKTENHVDDNYMNAENFSVFYNEAINKFKDNHFNIFAERCKSIFDQGDNMQKISTFLLLEQVSQKFFKYAQLIKKLSEFKSQDTENFYTYKGNADKDFDYFLTIDKIKKIK